MRRRKKASKDDRDLGTLVIDPTIAEMERAGTLRKAVQLRMKCRKLVAERDAVSEELVRCGGDLAWFDRFAMRMIRADKNVYESLQRRLGALDKRRHTLVFRIRELAEQISDLGLPVDIRPQPVTAGSGAASSDMQDVGLRRDVSGPAQYRDFLIRGFRHLSNENLCKRLDFGLALLRDQPSIGLPENWPRRFGVKTYSEAYQHPKCKNLVQKLIAEAKREL